MFKAWLVIFIWDPVHNYEFVEKVEVPFRSMAECRIVKKDDRTAHSSAYHIRKYCITNAHREGRRLDKDIPLEPEPFD